MKTPERQRLAWLLFPWYSPTLDAVNRNARVKSWLRSLPDVPLLTDREQMYGYLNNSVLKKQPIDFIELGVADGTSLRLWCEISSDSRSRFFGFDSFEGLPEPWGRDVPQGAFSQQGRVPRFDDPRVRIKKGLFQDTLPEFLRNFQPSAPLVVHHDSDLYSSVIYCLTQMDRLCGKGTILIFDEFTDPVNEFRAYEDYIQSYRRTLRPLAMADWLGVPRQVAFVME